MHSSVKTRGRLFAALWSAFSTQLCLISVPSNESYLFGLPETSTLSPQSSGLPGSVKVLPPSMAVWKLSWQEHGATAELALPVALLSGNALT